MRSLRAAAYARALSRLALRGWRERRASHPLPRQRLAVEKTGLRAEPRQVEAFLKVTAGERIKRFHGRDALLSPLYPAVWMTPLTLELMSKPQFPPLSGGVIHLETDLVWLRILEISDEVRCRLELEQVTPQPRGLRLVLLARIWNAPGLLCAESRSTLLIRGGTTKRGERKRDGSARAAPVTEGSAEWEEAGRWQLRGNHGRRYAHVSGDYNPIHLWRLTARPFGFRRPILHGFCIEALVAHALIAQRCGGDPERFRRLQTSFRAPLQLPADVRVEVAGAQNGGGRFRVVDDAARYAEGEFG